MKSHYVLALVAAFSLAGCSSLQESPPEPDSGISTRILGTEDVSDGIEDLCTNNRMCP